MRIIKLFKNHILALLVAIGLIVISCNADLALPSFMSEIVDVGIQQGGITSPVPDTIRDESLSDLELFMTKGDAKQVEGAYSKADKNGVRTYIGSEKDRGDEGALTNIMSLPETVALSLEQGIDASSMSDMTGKESSEKAGASAPTPEQMAAMTPEELAAMQQKAQAAAKMQEHAYRRRGRPCCALKARRGRQQDGRRDGLHGRIHRHPARHHLCAARVRGAGHLPE